MLAPMDGSNDDMNDANELQLIRRFVDGELPEGDARAFEARLADDAPLRDRVDFERRLRERVGAVMSEACRTPESLEAEVLSALRPGDQPAPAVDRPAAATEPARRSFAEWFGGPRHANVLAVAATLAIVAGAVLWGIFGRQIDDVPPPGETAQELVSRTADWASADHLECASMHIPAHAGASSLPSPEQAAQAVRSHLGVKQSVRVFDLTALGYELDATARCQCPGEAPSSHVIYVRTAKARSPAAASLYIVVDLGQYDGVLEAGGPTYDGWTPVLGGPECRMVVLGRREGALVYFLVCCDPNDLGPLAKHMAMRFAEPSG